MKPRLASQIAATVAGRLEGADVVVGPAVVFDSRQAAPGALFVAVAGEHVDGHDFAAAAAQRGAVAALVGRVVAAPLAQIVVPDPSQALVELARTIAKAAHANGMTCFGLTGSSGKTSTKDMLAQILEPVAPTVAPRGSYNNGLGLPITVTAVDQTTRFLVAEMGASNIGHIAWLCTIVRPDIAAVLNVGHAHIGEFGSQAAIAQAKGEIVEALPPDGWAVLNADDPLVAGMANRTEAQVAWFSPTGRPPAGAACWVAARDIVLDELARPRFHLVGQTPDGSFDEAVALRTLGAHQVANACAAAGLALCAGLAPGLVAGGLNRAVARSAWRMEPHRLAGGLLLLNDAYNANPDSVAAALDALAALQASHPGVATAAVLGDMLELGDSAPAAHQAIGFQAAAQGAVVVAVGDFADQIAQGARRAGGEVHVLAPDDVADWLLARPFGLVLVKGSRGAGLETVAGRLVELRGEEAAS